MVVVDILVIADKLAAVVVVSILAVVNRPKQVGVVGTGQVTVVDKLVRSTVGIGEPIAVTVSSLVILELMMVDSTSLVSILNLN